MTKVRHPHGINTCRPGRVAIDTVPADDVAESLFVFAVSTTSSDSKSLCMYTMGFAERGIFILILIVLSAI